MLSFAATENAYEYVDINVTGNTVTFGGTFTNNEGECFGGAGHNVEVKDGKIVRWDVGTSGQPCN